MCSRGTYMHFQVLHKEEQPGSVLKMNSGKVTQRNQEGLRVASESDWTETISSQCWERKEQKEKLPETWSLLTTVQQNLLGR